MRFTIPVNPGRHRYIVSVLFAVVLSLFDSGLNANDELRINNEGYFEKQGFHVLVFSNWYNGLFSDSKISGIEIIHHDIRTVTNGDVRLNSTPGQWDPIPEYIDRKVSVEDNTIEVSLKYPAFGFTYSLKVEARDGGIYLSVILDKPLPGELKDRAGFNLEFLPSAYFEKAYRMDENTGLFPLYPSGPMKISTAGRAEPEPLINGKKLVMAPEDPAKHITIQALSGELSLFDGRNQAQNGWFVVRSMIPSGKTGKVVEWFITANTIPGWIRPPVIAHSQVGYHPIQKKIAVIELDKNDTLTLPARLLKIDDQGRLNEIYTSKPGKWGNYLRYTYKKFDFSSVKEKGIYIIEYGQEKTKPFRIAEDIYENAWHPTLDVFVPVQMDHMFVNEAYRVWHGRSHMDDALQAPVSYEHFDLYAQGPETDSPYKPGEHIPGLNTGGWYDAGDFDIRTQTQYHMVLSLVNAWESFRITRDETTIDQNTKYTDIHVPDGIPDVLQQIEHGTLALMAQFKSVGHAIAGIIAPDLNQYTHLGDALSATDNQLCQTLVKPLKWENFIPSGCDDRWAFTSKSTPLNYGSAAALAAASRALRGYNDSLAIECIAIAEHVWKEEHSHVPDLFHYGNTTGGQLEQEELTLAVELLKCTHNDEYTERINQLLPSIEKQFTWNAQSALLALPYMDEAYRNQIEKAAKKYRQQIDSLPLQNPFNVPVGTGGWAGNGWVVYFSTLNYLIHKAFPEILGPEYVYSGLNYIFGCHPGSDISFVSGVGTHSKQVAYGYNRADFSFIAGGIVPGVLIIKPDFPENKEDWPFLWGENEYVLGLAGSYIFLVKAAEQLLKETSSGPQGGK